MRTTMWDVRLGGRPFAAWIRRIPSTVVAGTLLFGLTLVAWTQLVPLAQAPDESGHVALIQRLADGRSYPEYDNFHPYTGTMNAAIAHTIIDLGSPIGQKLTPEAAAPRGDRPTFEERGGRSPWGHANQLSQHPPLYYAINAAGLASSRALFGDLPLEREWAILRLGNVGLMVALPVLLWATVRRLGGTEPAAAAASLVPLAVPQLTYIGSSVNNDNLLILVSAVLTYLLARVATGDRRLVTSLLVGLAAAAGLWTKAFALVFLPWIAVVYLVAAWRSRARGDSPNPSIVRGLVAGATAVGGGGAWWLRNYFVHGEPFPSSLDAWFNRRKPGFEPNLLDHLREWIPSMVQGFWGEFASQRIRMSPALVIAATTLSIAAFAGALVSRAASGQRPDPARLSHPVSALVSIATLFPLLAVLLIYLDWSRYQNSGLHAFMQGRYMLGALPVFAVLLAIGADRFLGRRAPAAVLAAAAVMQAAAMHAALSGFWAEPGASWTRNLSSVAAWSPWPQVALLTLVASLAAALGGTVIALRKEAAPLRSG